MLKAQIGYLRYKDSIHLITQKWKYEEEDVDSYWMNVRRRDGTARRKRTQ